MLVFAAVFYTMVITNHYYFRTFAFDYGVYNFAFRDYAHFHISPCPVYKVLFPFNVNFLQDHFSFFLFFLAPVYWLLGWLTGTYTLLLVEVTLILWSGWAVYRLIKLKTGDPWLAIGGLLLYFLLHGRYSSFADDSNLLVMACCLIPLFIYFFEAKRFVIAGVFFVLAILSREDIALWFIFIFLVLMIWNRKQREELIFCISGIVISVLYFVLAFKVFIPAISSPDKPYNFFTYAALGTTPYQALGFIMRHPIKVFLLLFENQLNNPAYNGIKGEFYMVYLISGGAVLFFRPKYFIWFIPLLMQKMLNDEPMRWSINSYYSIQVVTLLPISVFMTLACFKGKITRRITGGVICCLALIVTINKMPEAARKMDTGLTIKENIFDSGFFKSKLEVRQVNTYLNQIPSDAKVSSSASILTHVSLRSSIYHFPSVEDADYITLVGYNDFWLMNDTAYMEKVYEYVFNPEWNVVGEANPFLMLKKEHNKTISAMYSCDAEKLTADSQCFVMSDGEKMNNAPGRSTKKVHSGKFSVKLNEENQYGFTWLPTDLTPGEIVQVTAWRYSETGSGVLVASDAYGFYKASKTAIENDGNGWDKIELTFLVPVSFSKLGIYAWNINKNPAWFDDIEVKVIRNPGDLSWLFQK